VWAYFLFSFVVHRTPTNQAFPPLQTLCPRNRAGWDPVLRLHGDVVCSDIDFDNGVPDDVGAPPPTRWVHRWRWGHLLFTHRWRGHPGGAAPDIPVGALAGWATKVVFGFFSTTVGASGPSIPFFRVIRVHTRVGEVDNGVCHVRAIASIGYVTPRDPQTPEECY
jgi:hypothetical protein